MAESKSFSSFVNSFLLAILNQREVLLVDTPLTEILVILIFRAIRDLKSDCINEHASSNASNLLKLVVESSSEEGSGSSISESITKIGISLLPSDPEFDKHSFSIFVFGIFQTF